MISEPHGAVCRAFPWTGKLLELADQAAKQLGKAMGADAVWLFGSAARGDADSDSDIDLMVILPDSDEPRYRRARRAHALIANIRVPKDVVVLTRQEWESELKVLASLPSTVKREGKLLYGS